MGWADGAEVMGHIIDAALEFIPDDDDRKGFYLRVIPVLEQQDWDTQDECEGKDDAFDEALQELHDEDDGWGNEGLEDDG